MTDMLDYDVLVDDALRGVMVRALKMVEREGLPGEHHFYITFRTDHPRVRIGEELRAKYPEEITVVIQHQFWDLRIDEKGFQIGLSFNQAPQALYIPYSSVIAFVDPSAKFGLQFLPQSGAGDHGDAGPGQPARLQAPEVGEPPCADSDNVVALDSFRKG
ncbi:MAG: hypothetical protein GDA49_02120 [Rhodospirillales bacterium]|nr:hypothetical protein [Rhodospirillales bacterium]